LRRVFVGDCPAWLAADKTKALLQGQAVDLVDHAVNVKGQLVPQGTDALVIRYQFRSALRNIYLGCDRKTP
jgi:hypothetical protein